MEKGKIIQISGPVVDLQFEKGPLPHIKEALTVENQGKKCVMEVAKQLGISRSYVSRIEKKAIGKLYEVMKDMNIQ